MKKTILITVLSCLVAFTATAQKAAETVAAEKTFLAIGGGLQLTDQFSLIDVGAQLEFGWWMNPYMGIGLNARAGLVKGSNPGADVIFAGKQLDASASLMGYLELTNIFLGAENGARAPFHIYGFAGLGPIFNSKAFDIWYWHPSIGLDFSGRLDKNTRIFLRTGLNLYHPISGITLYPEASAGVRFALSKGKKYPKDPAQNYKDEIAELEEALIQARIDAAKDTVILTKEVEKIVRDTVTLKVNQVDTLTIYDVVEVGTGLSAKIDTIYVKADTVFIEKDPAVQLDILFQIDTVFQVDTVYQRDTIIIEKEPVVITDTVIVRTRPEVLVKTVYMDNADSTATVDSVFTAPVYPVVPDTVYVVSEPVVLYQTDTVFVSVPAETIVVTAPADTVFLALEEGVEVPVQVDTVFVSTPADTVFVVSEPEVRVQVLTDTVYVASEPEVQVLVQTDTVFVESEPEIQVLVQTDTVFVESEPEIQVKVQTDTVYVESEPEIMVRTVYVNKEPIVIKDTVFVATDPEVQIQTVYRDKEPIILVDTLYVQSEPEIEVRTVYRDREVVKIQKDTVLVKSEPEIQIQVQKDTVFVPSEPEIMVRTVYVNKEPIIVKDTVFVATDPEVQIQTVYRDKEPVILVDTVYVQSEPEIQVKTVYRDREVVKVEKDTVYVQSEPEIQVEYQYQTDTIFLASSPQILFQKDTVYVETAPDTAVSLLKVVFPENAAWVNYGARKELDELAKEINAYEGDKKYLLIAPVSPDSEDPVKAYNFGVRRVSQVRLHLIRENGVDSRKIREQVIVSPLGIAVENGNAFVIVAREDDPRLEEIFSE